MRVPFLDLKITNQNERNLILQSMDKIMNHGMFMMGKEVESFEKKISLFCNRKYSVAVGSGTDALYLSLKSLGIGKGDEVITTSLSWIATANAISLVGAEPVFADIDDDLNMNVESINKLISKKTKAIIIVNYTGKICKYEEIQLICKKNKLQLIEDASQSFGAKRGNKVSGSIGNISAISHNPMKVLAGLGESGSILCNNLNLYKKIRALRYNGTINKEYCIEPSINGKIDTIQSAFLINRLKDIQNTIRIRNKYAKIYDNSIKPYVSTPLVKTNERHVYYTYTILTKKRNQLKKYLEKKGIQTKIQHPILMPEQKPYVKNKRIIKNAKKLKKQYLCLPIHHFLKEKQIHYVAKEITNFFKSK